MRTILTGYFWSIKQPINVANNDSIVRKIASCTVYQRGLVMYIFKTMIVGFLMQYGSLTQQVEKKKHLELCSKRI